MSHQGKRMRRRRAVGVRRVAMGRDQYGASEDGLEVSFEQYGVPLTNTTRQRMRWRVTAGRWLYMRSFAPSEATHGFYMRTSRRLLGYQA